MKKYLVTVLVALSLAFVAANGSITINGDRIIIGFYDFGGAVSLELPNSATPTTDAAGEIALDTTITSHQPMLQYFDGGENMTVVAIDTAQLPALDNEIVKYDAGSSKFVLEADAGGGGDSEKTHNIPLICDTPDTVTDPGETFVQAVNMAPVQVNVWQFRSDATDDPDGAIFCHIRVPNNLGATPAAAIVMSFAANNTTASLDVRLQVSTAPIADAETFDATFTAETAFTLAIPTTAYEREEKVQTLTNQPVADDILWVKIFRDGNHADDDLTATNLLLIDAALRIDLTL